MSNCRLIVCERTSHWASVLRASLGAREPQIVETRSLAMCEMSLAEASASLVAVVVTPDNLEAVVDFLRRLSQRFPRAMAVALLAHEAEAAARLLREAGAVDAIASVLEAPRLTRLARRRYAHAPKQEMALHEFVADQMPWPAYATPSEPA